LALFAIVGYVFVYAGYCFVLWAQKKAQNAIPSRFANHNLHLFAVLVIFLYCASVYLARSKKPKSENVYIYILGCS
jgi:hypothetical protein